jgi:hypothetical protein
MMLLLNNSATPSTYDFTVHIYDNCAGSGDVITTNTSLGPTLIINAGTPTTIIDVPIPGPLQSATLSNTKNLNLYVAGSVFAPGNSITSITGTNDFVTTNQSSQSLGSGVIKDITTATNPSTTITASGTSGMTGVAFNVVADNLVIPRPYSFQTFEHLPAYHTP